MMTPGILAFAAGCGSTHHIEVSGQVRSDLTLNPPVRRVYLTEPAEVAGQPPDILAAVKVLGADPFGATVEMQGHTLDVYVFEDRNDDGVCSEGEESFSKSFTISDLQSSVDASLDFYPPSKVCPAFLGP